MRGRKQERNILTSDQQGSTLFMVIICIAFMVILGSLMLSLSMINLRMKQVENTSKGNFYTCERALEEIRTGLEELSTTTIRTTYEEVLVSYVHYSAMDDATRNEEIQDLVLTKLSASVGSDLSVIATKFCSFLSEASNYTITVGAITTSNIPLPYTNTMTFHNVRVEYNQNNYKTVLTSDLKISLPSFIFSKTADTISYSMQQIYEGYAVVADGNIISDNAEGNNYITGSLYSGLDLRVKDTNLNQNHTLTLNGTNIVIRGDMIAEDTGELIIGNSTRPLIWANNLRTVTSGSYPATSSQATTLDINGVCLIKDDLTLDGRNSNASFDGAYIGYTGADSAKGSAIIINGSGTSLDLSGLSSLVLAGRAHVSVEDSILKSTVADPNINIMTGESLAFKSNQRAYLVPGQYILLDDGTTTREARHNPLTQKDLATASPDVVIHNIPDAAVFDCFDYIEDRPNHYQVAAKQLVSSATSMLRYYYLNFRSGKHADRYLVDYISEYPDNLQVFDAFSLHSVKLPEEEEEEDRIISAGNVMYYDETHPEAPIKYLPGLSDSKADDAAMDNFISSVRFSVINHDEIYSGSGLEDKDISELSDIYFNLTHNLTPTAGKRMYLGGEPLVASTVIRSGIHQVISELNTYIAKSPEFTCYNSLPLNTWSSTAETTKSIVVLNGDAVIETGSIFNGIFIATGNVTIGAGARINGIVLAAGNGATSAGNIIVQNGVEVRGRLIAEGNVTLQENCNISCIGSTSFEPTLTINQFLADIFDKDGSILWKMFVNPEPTVNILEGSTNTDLVNINNLVTFENWRMNE